MVELSLTVGGAVGVLLSGGFIWWEVGRYATPQVPATVFDERKVLAAYTVGLFVGVPVAVAYVLLLASLANGALPGAALFLAGIVGIGEVAQLLLVRSRYWGSSPAVPFYVVSMRAGVGGILAVAAVADYLGGVGTPGALGLTTTLLAAVALVVLEVAEGFLSFRARRPSPAPSGGPLAGALFGAVAFFLLGLGPTAGPVGALAAPLLVLAGAGLAYRGRRRLLAEVPAPTAAPSVPAEERPLAYGRTAPLPAGRPRDGKEP
jgi:hypothetical protein